MNFNPVGALTRPPDGSATAPRPPLPGNEEVAAIVPKRNSREQAFPYKWRGFREYVLCNYNTAAHKNAIFGQKCLFKAEQGVTGYS